MAKISDINFQGWQYTLSTIGGIAISISGALTIAFSIGQYNEWETSVIDSIVDDNPSD